MYQNNGQPKRIPPMGRAGSRALRENTGNNMNRMFNSNSAVQNIPSQDMNRFRNMQQQVAAPQTMAELEHWRNQSMMLMQQMQQMQQQMQMMQQQQPPAQPLQPQPQPMQAQGGPAPLLVPNPTPTQAQQPMLPPKPPIVGGQPKQVPSSPSFNQEIQQLKVSLTEVTNELRALDSRVFQLAERIEETDLKIDNIYKYLQEWNAALQQDPAAATSSSSSASITNDGQMDLMDNHHHQVDPSSFVDIDTSGTNEMMDQDRE